MQPSLGIETYVSLSGSQNFLNNFRAFVSNFISRNGGLRHICPPSSPRCVISRSWVVSLLRRLLQADCEVPISINLINGFLRSLESILLDSVVKDPSSVAAVMIDKKKKKKKKLLGNENRTEQFDVKGAFDYVASQCISEDEPTNKI